MIFQRRTTNTYVSNSEFLKEVSKVAIDRYGEQYVGLVDDSYVVIHYPRIQITNENGDEHEITDLYVKVLWDEDDEYDDEDDYRYKFFVKGLRGSKTLAEFKSQYNHSHLPSGNHVSYGVFCLGGDESPLGRLAERLTEHYEDATPITYAISLVEAIHSFIRWESIEGGPYQSMSNITAVDTEVKDLDNVTLAAKQRAYNRLRRHNSLFSYPKIKSHRNRLFFYYDYDEYERVLSRVSNEALVFKTPDGKYLQAPGLANLNTSDFTQNSIVFKGARVPCKIADDNNALKNLKRVVHPDIVQYCIIYYNNHINTMYHANN